MLYRKITVVAGIIYAFFSSPTDASTYLVSSVGAKVASNYPYTCGSVSNCRIYCDVADHKEELEFHCGSSGNCKFYCNAQKCGNKATIYGENADSLLVYGQAKECLKDSVVYAPNSGNAYFYNGNTAEKPYKGMDVYSGSNTQEIILNCDGIIGDECKGTNIHASSAQFLQINVGYQVDFNDATVECPASLAYDGPQIAPCIIDATTGYLYDVDIWAPWGVPQGLHITGASWYKSVKLYCTTVDALNGAYEGRTSNYPFTTTDDCYWTPAPTSSPTRPTKSPTDSPTSAPTPAPTYSPTHAPTFSPTAAPTDAPTLAPTLAPTFSPTLAPTQPPTNAPTQETESPTAAPTISPTEVTESPTNAPTFSPTLAPTMSPTASWYNCLDYMECDYIAKATFVVYWKASDTFDEFVATLNGMTELSIVMDDAIEIALSGYISPVNMKISVFLRSGSNADMEYKGIVDATADIATDYKSKMESLIYDTDEADTLVNKLWPPMIQAITAKYDDSSFEVPEIDITIQMIKPETFDDEDEDEDTKKDKKESLSPGFIVLIVCGVLLLIVLLLIYGWKRRKKPKAPPRKKKTAEYVDEDSDDDIFGPNFTSSSAKTGEIHRKKYAAYPFKYEDLDL